MLTEWITNPHAGTGVSFLSGDKWQRFSYVDLAQLARRKAAQLRLQGVEAGEVVPIVVGQGPEFVANFFGLIWIGAIPTVLPPPKSLAGSHGYGPFLSGIVGAGGVRYFIAENRYRDALDDAVTSGGRSATWLSSAVASDPAEADQHPGGDTVIVQFTSGSRGNPRGLCISRANLEANLRMIRSWLGYDGHGGVSWLPLYHDMGLIGGLLSPITAQAEHEVMSPSDFVRDPARWLLRYGNEPYAVMFMPNFGFEWVEKNVTEAQLSGCDFSSLRAVISGSDRVQLDSLSKFAALLAPHGFRFTALTPAYGLAEGTLAVTGIRPGTLTPALDLGRHIAAFGSAVEVLRESAIDDAQDFRAGWLVSCGTPLDGVELTVRSIGGDVLADLTVGEIWARAESIAKYYCTEQGRVETARVGGWLRTGDSGFLHNRHLYLIGRIGDSIKVRGESVHMEDLEGQLADILQPGLFRRSCVVGSVIGDLPLILVVTEFDVDAADWAHLVDIVNSVVAGTDVHWVRLEAGELPMTTSGKPRRREVWLRHGAATMSNRG